MEGGTEAGKVGRRGGYGRRGTLSLPAPWPQRKKIGRPARREPAEQCNWGGLWTGPAVDDPRSISPARSFWTGGGSLSEAWFRLFAACRKRRGRGQPFPHATSRLLSLGRQGCICLGYIPWTGSSAGEPGTGTRGADQDGSRGGGANGRAAYTCWGCGRGCGQGRRMGGVRFAWSMLGPHPALCGRRKVLMAGDIKSPIPKPRKQVTLHEEWKRGRLN